MSELTELRRAMREFSEERDWGSFHDPKSVLLALVGEVGELAELLQWLPADRVAELARDETLHRRLGEEMSDVLLYLVLLADVLDVDLAAAAPAKLAEARVRYPAGVTPDRENKAR
jgi:NTP pyrophosphatase (non-canonical NTP hydrolase)